VDDLRLGRIARVLRQRLGLRQTDIADRAHVSQNAISRIERGRLEAMSLRMLRTVAAALDAEIVVFIRWRGGDLDRVLDARHAAMVEAMLRRLELASWEVQPEVSYSSFGERGSIDLLAWHAASRTLLVVEVKTELTSIEETLRKHDVKVRLASNVARDRLGWGARTVVRLLVLPDHRTARRRIEQHAGSFGRVYPLQGLLLRRWLLDPGSPNGTRSPREAGALLFLPPIDGKRGKQRIAPQSRVRRSQPPPAKTA